MFVGFSFAKVNAQPDSSGVIVIDKVESELIKPDRVGATRSGGNTREQKWVLIEFTFAVTPPKEAKTGFLEEVQFKVMVEARDEDGPFRSTSPVFLSGDVTYICVPASTRTYGSFYIPADVAARYHIDKNLTQGNINVQAFVGGQMVDSKDKRPEDKDDWYANYKTIANLVFNKNQ